MKNFLFVAPQSKSRTAASPRGHEKSARPRRMIRVFAVTAFAALFFMTGAAQGCADEATSPPAEEEQATPLADAAQALPTEQTPTPQPAQALQTEQTPAPKPKDEPVTITLSFAGDTTLGNNVGKSFFADTYKSKGAGWFFGDVKKLFAEDDLTIVNLEGALTDNTTHINKPGSTVFYFRGSPGYTKILTEGSVEVCNLANNHSRDYGEKGYADTKKALKKAGLRSYVCDAVAVVNVKGVKIGFVGVQFTSSKSEITSLIQKAKKKDAKVIIFTSHDGTEGSYKPTARQREAAKIAIDAGADAAIFHHPHVIQGTETYKGKFIAWSLGNFCFGGNSNPSDKDSMIVQLRIIKTGGKFSITPEVIPARLSSHDGYNDLRPKIATGKTKSRIEKKIKKNSGDYL